MENENINSANPGGSDQETSIPVSAQMPGAAPNLSTATANNPVPSPDMANNEPVPMQENKKKEFFFDGQKIDMPKPENNVPPTLNPSGTMASSSSLSKIELPKKDLDAMTASLKNKKPLKISKKIIIIIAIAAAVVIIAGILAYFMISMNKKIPVKITVDQAGATLVIDGQAYSNINSPYTISLSSGSHSITVQKIGFAALQKTVNISSQSNTVSFSLSALPKIEKVIDGEAFFPAYDKDANVFSYFDKSDAGYTLKQFDLTAQKENDLLESIYDIDKVAWSPTFRQLAIKVTDSTSLTGGQIPYLAQYPDGTKINWIVSLDRSDLVNVNMKDLPPAIKNITFSPTGDKIAYLFENGTDKELGMANTDGSGFSSLLQFKTIAFEPDVVWSPDGNKIAIFVNTENGAESNATSVDVYIYDFTKKSGYQITTDGTSSGALFSPDGSKLLYQSGNDIWSYDLTNSDPTKAAFDLKLQASLANCAWVDSNSFVALSNSDNALYEFSASGIKNNISYQTDSLPASIKEILYGNNKVFILNTDGVYQLQLAGNV